MIRMYVTACFAMLLTAGTLSAQTTFEATTDARRVLENSYFEVTFTLSNAQGGQFSPPSFEDFLVVSATHTYIMNRRDVAEQIVHFLREGSFFREESIPTEGPQGPEGTEGGAP